jgi:hypothetical protein
MSFSNYPRCARTASKVGHAGRAGTVSDTASQVTASVSSARAPHKEISFAEVVSAQIARGEGAQ